MQMNFYNCVVKLGGDPVLMSAPRLHVSEYEVRLLKHIHGDDAILHISKIETKETDEATHLFQLARFYNDKKRVEELFRRTLDNFDAWLEESLIAEEQEREQRFQMAQVEHAGRRAAPSISGGDALQAPGVGASRGADPRGNDTTGVAAAAEALAKSTEEAADKTLQNAATAKPATQPSTKPRAAVD